MKNFDVNATAIYVFIFVLNFRHKIWIKNCLYFWYVKNRDFGAILGSF